MKSAQISMPQIVDLVNSVKIHIHCLSCLEITKEVQLRITIARRMFLNYSVRLKYA